MTRTLLVAGTASHVGKSTVAAGLCRLLADRGVDVAPFKAQNMSNNARVVPRAPATVDRARDADTVGNGVDTAVNSVDTADNGVDTAGSGVDDDVDTVGDSADTAGNGVDDEVDDDAVAENDANETTGLFGEIGVSQYAQARAARWTPTTDVNPVLLKPRGGGESQLVVDGVAVGHFPAGEYFERHWSAARAAAEAAHRRLAADADLVVAEGAGSIAEINLQHRDLANVETARFAECDILLVADIERGGVFASLVGTLELMPADLRERVVGAVITKFRGDRSLLEDGLTAFEERTGVPIVGVLPYEDPGLPAEDSVSLPAPGERQVVGEDDVAPEQSVTIGVPRLPRASNVTDLEPLAAEPGVRVAYLPLTADLGDCDAIVIPGTKNTVDDLRSMRSAGFDDALRAFDGPIVGLCGGYQILGERIHRAEIEASGGGDEASGDGDASSDVDDEANDVDDGSTLAGVGLLPVETTFSADKRVVDTTLTLEGTGPLTGASGTISGYEIHMGRTEATAPVETPFAAGVAGEVDAGEIGGDRAEEVAGDAALGAADGDVLGCYLHGLFENEGVRDAFVDRVFAAAGRKRPTSTSISSSTSASTMTGSATAESSSTDPSSTDSPSADAAADGAAALIAEHCSLAFLEREPFA